MVKIEVLLRCIPFMGINVTLGDELAFSPVDVLGNKTLSHTIRLTTRGYVVRTADEVEIGPFHTFAAAERAAEARQAGRDR